MNLHYGSSYFYQYPKTDSDFDCLAAHTPEDQNKTILERLSATHGSYTKTTALTFLGVYLASSTPDHTLDQPTWLNYTDKFFLSHLETCNSPVLSEDQNQYLLFGDFNLSPVKYTWLTPEQVKSQLSVTLDNEYLVTPDNFIILFDKELFQVKSSIHLKPIYTFTSSSRHTRITKAHPIKAIKDVQQLPVSLTFDKDSPLELPQSFYHKDYTNCFQHLDKHARRYLTKKLNAKHLRYITNPQTQLILVLKMLGQRELYPKLINKPESIQKRNLEINGQPYPLSMMADNYYMANKYSNPDIVHQLKYAYTRKNSKHTKSPAQLNYKIPLPLNNRAHKRMTTSINTLTQLQIDKILLSISKKIAVNKTKLRINPDRRYAIKPYTKLPIRHRSPSLINTGDMMFLRFNKEKSEYTHRMPAVFLGYTIPYYGQKSDSSKLTKELEALTIKHSSLENFINEQHGLIYSRSPKESKLGWRNRMLKEYIHDASEAYIDQTGNTNRHPVTFGVFLTWVKKTPILFYTLCTNKGFFVPDNHTNTKHKKHMSGHVDLLNRISVTAEDITKFYKFPTISKSPILAKSLETRENFVLIQPNGTLALMSKRPYSGPTIPVDFAVGLGFRYTNKIKLTMQETWQKYILSKTQPPPMVDYIYDFICSSGFDTGYSTVYDSAQQSTGVINIGIYISPDMQYNDTKHKSSSLHQMVVKNKIQSVLNKNNRNFYIGLRSKKHTPDRDTKDFPSVWGEINSKTANKVKDTATLNILWKHEYLKMKKDLLTDNLPRYVKGALRSNLLKTKPKGIKLKDIKIC